MEEERERGTADRGGGADVPDLAWRRLLGREFLVVAEEEEEEELEEEEKRRWLCRAGWVWRRLLDKGQLLVVAHVHVVVHGVRA